ncbi:4-hydroxythreonine-4-phosphate dehydrogenase PdxA [Pontixanthobacter gangjinensis]|uniref:4-hydroxythreonine-4-phosphate dehydrogenase n=1 Tax=Pontixanthobacter gangjinensis TaxID=1028742 RepID=A0A6I4SRL9_9SPHN|nr:4-hydroxythreonine-4-phosphate dehydrogenase PdxA [Pontixanthobacter gangjinensis]MXO57557.1 4-hydroxythreonine-4-phosphate dehydrogenase PdxA [Pontixanthobacter gangjinensis]
MGNPPKTMGPIALSIGDPAGVGPEIIALAWNVRKQAALAPFFAVGGASVLAAAAQQRGLDMPLRHVSSISEACEVFDECMPVFGAIDSHYSPGKPSEEGARLALASLRGATKLAVGEKVSAIATAPIAKSRLAEIGFTHPGQTEYLARACGLADEQAVMMLAGPQLKAIPLTVHCALSDVPGLITADLIIQRTRIAVAALRRDFGLEQPRIAIAGLNPHAGEGGKFGSEELEIIVPAIAALRSQGIDATGPHPADAMFAPHARGNYDVALCMYHDQALIPVKALDFDQGVNVTLGLPIIRTSPDHGTAFDIAGKNIANAGAMIAAIKMAGDCATRRARQN